MLSCGACTDPETCGGGGRPNVCGVRLPVLNPPPLDQTVATTLDVASAFLYQGPDPVQQGADAGAFEAKRVAVLKGRATVRGGAALPGVRVRIAGMPQYGWTFTRADGAFDLVVNGGETLVVDFFKPGFLEFSNISLRALRRGVVAQA